MNAGLAASVHARLLKRARQRGEDFNLILTRYATERGPRHQDVPCTTDQRRALKIVGMISFTEFVVEEAELAWLQVGRRKVALSPGATLSMLATKRDDTQLMLCQRLRGAWGTI